MKRDRSGIRSIEGAITLPLSITLLLIAATGFGVWAFLRNWRQLAESQLLLDRCVGEKARKLRKTLNFVETMNSRIVELRATIPEAMLVPGAAPPLQAALAGVALAQEGALLKWKGEQAAWIAARGCASSHGVPLPLPSLSYLRPPPDAIGPQALIATGVPSEFRLTLKRGPRIAVAFVMKGEAHGSWFATWSKSSAFAAGANSD